MMYFLDFQRTLTDGSDLYPDVPEFLRMLGNEALIVSRGSKESDGPIIEKALADIVRVTVLYTDGKPKAEFMATWPGYYGSEAVFVDDSVKELTLLAEKFPKLKLFEMRRDGEKGDGRWPVIHSLNELP